MAGKIYKTANGVTIDIDQLRLLNERVVAVGNMGVNSRGDRVNSDGSIKEGRNEIMKKTYRTNAVVAGKGIINSRGEAIDPSTKTKSAGTTTAPVNTVRATLKDPQVTSHDASHDNSTTDHTAQAADPVPSLLRGSLAQSVAGVEQIPQPDSQDLLSTSSNTRTIKRI